MDEMRDNLREIVRGHLKDKVRLLELEYQPVASESVAAKAVKNHGDDKWEGHEPR